jgi:FkbM family methyltransferase
MGLFTWLRQQYWKRFAPKPRVQVQPVPVLRLGSAYGGWVIPKDIFHKTSICYLAGAGEDITFDIALAEMFNCRVHIFDPTPRAAAYVRKTLAALPLGVQENLAFHQVGIWNDDTELKFYAPANPAHVSHSAVNLHDTDNYFIAPAKKLHSLMAQLKHTRLDLLKLDIEGAEYAVLDDIVQTGLDVRCICVEFDECHHPQDGRYAQRVEGILGKLAMAGYAVVHAEGKLNVTLLKK